MRVICSAYAASAESTCRQFIDEFTSAPACDGKASGRQYTFTGVFMKNALVGFGAYSPSGLTDKIWELAWGTMHREHQGKGYGHALLDFRIDQIAQEAKTDEVYVTVFSYPTRLFLDNGFTPAFSNGTKSLMWKKIR